MNSKEKQSDLIINIEEIEKESLEIYPEGEESKECDKKLNEIYKIKNWGEMFYHGKTKILKERFLSIISKSEHSKFFEGLDYEYGINGKPKDIKIAFEIYKKQADDSTDVLSMYKMYHIYKNEFSNFGFLKRNRILEKYYLFKCFTYLPKYQIQGNSFLLNRFNVPLEVAINIHYEDISLNKFEKLINHLNKYINYYKIKKYYLLLIESSMIYAFNNNISKKAKAIKTLNELYVYNQLEVFYKIGTIISKDGNEADIFFEALERKKYYRSFCDYAIYLFTEKKNYKKALELLKIASENGVLKANYLYFDIFLNNIDFTKIEINKEFIDNLILIFNMLINDIVTDGAFSLFEYFYLRKICIKHWNLKELVDSKFKSFTTDFVSMIMNNTCLNRNEEEIKAKKELIKTIYQREEYFSEFHLSCGILYYYGIEDIINMNLEKSLLNFQISFDNLDSKSYKRFCHSYITRIKKKLHDKVPEKVSHEENEEAKKVLFDLYKNSIEKEYINILSSSFFYYLSRLYHKKLGNPGNEIMEYICLKRASNNSLKMPGNGSVISYYRKYKSIISLQKNEEIYKFKINGIKPKQDSEGYGDDNSICPICMENKRNAFLYPCKHLFCKFCLNKIMEKAECPICRELILFNFDFENNNSNIK